MIEEATAKERGIAVVTTYIIAGIILIVLGALVFWVTNKAYSRKWEDD